MTDFSRRTFGSALVLGAATIAGVAAVPAPASAASRRGATGATAPIASPDVRLTEAFRRFGDSGGGWSNHRGWAASDGLTPPNYRATRSSG